MKNKNEVNFAVIYNFRKKNRCFKPINYSFFFHMSRSAGMLIFVHASAQSRMTFFVNEINDAGRVSPEVLSLHLVTPTRKATKALSDALRDRPELQYLERIERLRPNNAMRDLTAPWRLDPNFAEHHKLLVNLETVNPDFRKKYPDPNLTLPAGGVEQGEHPYMAAHRELFEETRIRVHPRTVGNPIGLFRGGIKMYPVVVTNLTPMYMHDGVLYIGFENHFPETMFPKCSIQSMVSTPCFVPPHRRR